MCPLLLDRSFRVVRRRGSRWLEARSIVLGRGVCGSGKLTRGHMDALNAIHGDIEPMINFLGLKNSPIWSVQPMT
jgi:hypothetical protein